MHSLLRNILTHRFFVLLISAGLVLAGLAAWQKLPIDAFPDVTNVQVMVLTQADGLTAADVEQRLTYPIEQKMGGVPHVVQVRSLSKNGLSQVVVIFEDGTDIYFARQMVLERLEEARANLPPGVEPELAPISTGLGEIFQYTLAGGGLSATDLRSLQDWLVAPALRPIPGVTEVNSFGGFMKEYHVLVRPERLIKYRLSMRDILDTIERNNANAGGQFIVKGWEQTYIRSIGLVRSPEELGEIVLKASDGVAVRLRDVASIEPGHAERQGAVTRDGKGEAVAGMVIMLKDANARDVVDRVKAAIPGIRRALPKGVELDVFYDRTSLIEACIATVVDATFEGGVCVILVLFLFLAELRTALLVVLSLPFTFLASFLVMRWWGMTANLMSLGGLAFSVGMVVDATVVVAENARRHLAHRHAGESRIEAIASAISEVARPTIFSIFIIVIVLVPLLTLEGMEGRMFGPLAATMLIALAASLVVAFLLVPAWSVWMLPAGEEREFGFIRAIHRAYEGTVAAIMRRPFATAMLALALLAGTVRAGRDIGTEFMPLLDEGALAINAVRLPNASLDGAVTVAGEIERLLANVPEIETVVSKTGRAEISEDPMGPEQTDIFVMLKSGYQKTRSRDAVIDDVRTRLASVPGLRYSFSQPIALRVNELISGIKSDVAVKVFGPDLEVLASLSRQVTEILGKVPGAVDAKATQLAGMSQLDIEVDRSAAARWGLNVSDVNELIETAVGGRLATTLVEGEKRIGVRVRYPRESRNDAEAIGRLTIPAPDGTRVPLAQVARLKTVEVPIEVTRENGRRRMVVEGNVRGRDLGGFVADLRQRLAPLMNALPTGYFIELGGQFENQQRAMTRLAWVVPFALTLIVILLMLALGNGRDAVLVILNLPFALIGGVLALRASGLTFSVSAAVAFIVLLGIAVQNGVLLLAFFRQRINEGIAVFEAVKEGCAVRFRPLMMTALTSFIGHLPMLAATGSGADIQKPLAIVVMGGLVTSTALTLLVLPVLFTWTESQFGRPAKTDIQAE
ncbi:MAG TPA: CusA/CzcA family heavy metal efflux RND transporter [Candidatus Ozemobacteraceae bacterium]|nr:CusA/CzcA family heavy metal efflux RND transporter [Candidatus Ozemobacteraceae bacterium]